MTDREDTLPSTEPHLAHVMLAVPQGLPEALDYFCDVYKVPRDDVLDLVRLLVGAAADVKNAHELARHLRGKLSPTAWSNLRETAALGCSVLAAADTERPQ